MALRGPVEQVALRVTTSLSEALKLGPPAGLRCTIADLHTTLLGLYIADGQLRAQTHQLLRDRAKTPS